MFTERSGGGDEAVYDDRFLQCGGPQDQAGDPADLEAAHLGKDVQAVRGRERLCQARSMTLTLWLNCPASIPVPWPVTSLTGAPLRTATIALLGVVFPIPMSPVPKTSTEEAALRAQSIPASTARIAFFRLMAGPRAMFFVPGPIRRETIFPASASSQRSAATPMSTTVTDAPTWRARALIPAPPATKLYTIWGVTSWGILAHPLGDDAVVPGHREDRLAGDRRVHRTGDPREILGEVEETAEGPAGHGQRFQAPVRLRPDGGVLGNDCGDGFLQQTHFQLLLCHFARSFQPERDRDDERAHPAAAAIIWFSARRSRRNRRVASSSGTIPMPSSFVTKMTVPGNARQAAITPGSDRPSPLP